MVLVGNDFYVANTDAVVRFPYVTGQTRITAPGAPSGGHALPAWSPDGRVLATGAGYTDKEITALREEGVVG